MPTTVADLKEWFERGKKEHATHMIVVCDTFDYEDYPVYVKKTENVREVTKKYDGPNMAKVMEVYSYKKTFEEQGKGGTRVFNYD
jgi:hypothetical protein